RSVAPHCAPISPPAERPLRQITWHLCPVRASRENASRRVAGSATASSTVIFAPELEMFSTTHWRAAKPPSSVIHAGWLVDFRASRFLGAVFVPLIGLPTPRAADLSKLLI